MKSHVQVAVIGGGVVGCSVLYHLTKAGWRDVVLLERDQLTSGSTFHSAGLVGQLRGSVSLTKMMMHSVDLYRRIGRGGLSLDRDDDHRRTVSSAVSRAEADAEIRQMREARNTRRAARGEAPLDVDEELARLTAPVIDPQLESEIRSLVVARNARRERQGKPQLDIEDEVRRQIAELGGS